MHNSSSDAAASSKERAATTTRHCVFLASSCSTDAAYGWTVHSSLAVHVQTCNTCHRCEVCVECVLHNASTLQPSNIATTNSICAYDAGTCIYCSDRVHKVRCCKRTGWRVACAGAALLETFPTCTRGCCRESHLRKKTRLTEERAREGGGDPRQQRSARTV